MTTKSTKRWSHNQIRKMQRRIFHITSSHHSENRQINKISNGLENNKQSDSQEQIPNAQHRLPDGQHRTNNHTIVR